MLPSISISQNEARRLFLTSQLPVIDDSKSASVISREIIEQLGYVQIDTISVVERSHHLVMHSRIPKYRQEITDKLVDDKIIFEYWWHAAAYIPMNNFRFSLIRKRNYSKRHSDWRNANRKILKYVIDRIKGEGPLMSKDFDDNRNGTSGWWNRKPSKDALDFLFHEGKLMVLKRAGFQKVYELPENVIPAAVNVSMPNENEFYKHLILQTLTSFGFASEREITYLRKYDKKKFANAANELLENRSISNFKIHGIENQIFYSVSDYSEKIDAGNVRTGARLFSPLDNLVIQRKRLRDLFDFDFQAEFYLPSSKRKYGYFCMPVLYDDRFVARVDLKSDRSIKTLYVKSIHWEDSVRQRRKIESSLKHSLIKLAEFSGCNVVSFVNNT